MFHDKEVRNKILPYLNSEIFADFHVKEVIENIINFGCEYSKFPSIPELKVYIKNEEVYNFLLKEFNSSEIKEFDKDFINGEVENFFKDKLYHNELMSGLRALSEDNEEKKTQAPDKLREALSFSFDTNVGLNFLEASEQIYESLHAPHKVIPLGIKKLDELIDGGVQDKTLNLFMASTGVGKSITKMACAANNIRDNRKVLYITLEMSEFKVSKRIMANLFNEDINNLKAIPLVRFKSAFEKIKKQVDGKLIIKEFPTRSANTNMLRNLLKELDNKQKFKPDIIYVDYLGIMIPNRANKFTNTNTELKTISEELRGLAMEYGLPIVSSVQTNRGGFGVAETDLTDIAESIGITNTADIFVGITSSPELKQAGRYMFNILKNREGEVNVKFPVGISYKHMKLFDVKDDEDDSPEESKQELENGRPVTPKGTKSTVLVDEGVTDIMKTFKKNKKTERNRIIGVKM